ncbi:MAG: glutamate--cysteine ligase [Bacteriovoracaceae bacterium]
MNYKVNDKSALEDFVLNNWQEMNEYLCSVSKELPIPVYSSVDIRESKTKFAPVDHNMYPAGFNNVCKKDLANCAEHFKKYFLKMNEHTKHVAIIPESHTKNLFYLDHLYSLKTTVENAGFEVTIVSLDEALMGEEKELVLTSQSSFEVKISKGQVVSDQIVVPGKEPIDIALLNHDQSNPLNVNWETMKTIIVPTPKIGWFKRQKNEHFTYYKMVADAFCQQFNINPDLIQAHFIAVDKIDFNTKEGLEALGKAVDDLKANLAPETQIFVKASQGTYGMGISVVGSGEEIINMNRKGRNKMDVGKNNIKFTSVLVQEGVETIVKYDDMPAEITIYLIGGKALGGFMRANPLRSTTENLNAKGMVYKKLCLADICKENEHTCKEAVYSVLARLATIASAYEIKNVL